ncbi:hypothetical protein DXA38_09300 [[Clostridium] innocuum]|uniref:Uncharacterized protein n=1 Tax=Clostridium innocuum TaxID=1522 RepID=A0A3E2VXT2_CLOIN|nr:hypothetical protein DXA38_09300 [[Clostridium] innocuum]RHV63923.1 hypothetical protein DXB22_11655 [Clostridiaceae bacterium OM02-2AC]
MLAAPPRFIKNNLMLCAGRLTAQKREGHDSFSHIALFRLPCLHLANIKMPASHRSLQIRLRVSEPAIFPEIAISIASMPSFQALLLYAGIAYVLQGTAFGIHD